MIVNGSKRGEIAKDGHGNAWIVFENVAVFLAKAEDTARYVKFLLTGDPQFI
jgi:hypothetical protein